MRYAAYGVRRSAAKLASTPEERKGISGYIDPPIIERILPHIGEPTKIADRLARVRRRRLCCSSTSMDHPIAPQARPDIDQTGGRDTWD